MVAPNVFVLQNVTIKNQRLKDQFVVQMAEVTVLFVDYENVPADEKLEVYRLPTVEHAKVSRLSLK